MPVFQSNRFASHYARSNDRNPAAFTLIELLVVIGVLVFLIAMLFPALSKAQRQSRTVTCLSNLHQLYMGYAAYLPQNHQQSLRYDPTYAGAFWPEVLRPTFPDVKDILKCPEAAAPSYGLGTAKSSWGPYDPAHGSPASMAFVGNVSSSYGFNGWLYASDDDYTGGHRWLRAKVADRVPVFAESTWVDGWPPNADGTTADLPAGVNGADAGLKRFDLARHGNSINASFLDGHAEQIPLERIDKQHWSTPTHFDPNGFHRVDRWGNPE